MKVGNRYWLKGESVRELVDQRHLSHQEFAALLGVSRAYWSQIVNGRRALTPKVRRALLVALPGDEARLWRIERRPLPGAAG
ncbi:MAG: helix-turn-helix domain-containing protein [Myxococcota bacterium]